MHRLSMLLALSTLTFGATSGYLLWLWSAEREQASGLRSQLTRCSEARRVGPAGDFDGAETDVRALHTTQAQPPRTKSSAPGSATPCPPAAPAQAPSFAPPSLTPEQEALLDRRRYRAEFRALKLSEQEITAVLPLLKEQERRGRKPVPRSSLDENGLGLSPAHLAEVNARNDAELSSVLGPERAAEFQRLRGTKRGRANMQMLRYQLEDSDEPISREQEEILLSIVKNRSSEPAPVPVEGESPQESSERFLAWRARNNESFRDAASAVLTPGQLNTLDEETKLQEKLFMPPALQARSAAGAAAP